MRTKSLNILLLIAIVSSNLGNPAHSQSSQAQTPPTRPSLTGTWRMVQTDSGTERRVNGKPLPRCGFNTLKEGQTPLPAPTPTGLAAQGTMYVTEQMCLGRPYLRLVSVGGVDSVGEFQISSGSYHLEKNGPQVEFDKLYQPKNQRLRWPVHFVGSVQYITMPGTTSKTTHIHGTWSYFECRGNGWRVRTHLVSGEWSATVTSG